MDIFVNVFKFKSEPLTFRIMEGSEPGNSPFYADNFVLLSSLTENTVYFLQVRNVKNVTD
jgi:hypothetical protein